MIRILAFAFGLAASAVSAQQLPEGARVTSGFEAWMQQVGAPNGVLIAQKGGATVLGTVVGLDDV